MSTQSTKKRLRIFSLGGNEVSPIDGASDIPHQWQRTVETCKRIANVIEAHPDDYYVITHGNGPQVGNILLRSEYSRPILHPIPLDVCSADSQGAMGYMLAQLANELRIRGLDKVVTESITQVVVDKNDPGFQNPTKYIGPAYTKEVALQHEKEDGWKVKLYGTDKEQKEIWRRVVPSPVPLSVVEIAAVEALLESGHIPISVGGGGIPVVKVQPQIIENEEHYICNYDIHFKRPHDKSKPSAAVYSGVEAVIDKDLASALLGTSLIERAKSGLNKLGKDLEVSLTIFTAEDGAKIDYKKPTQKDLRHLTLAEAKKVVKEHPESFPAGSMGPKMNAVIQFIENGGHVAHITKTDLFEKTLKGEAGTTLVP